MESDLLVGQSMMEILDKTKQHFSILVRIVRTTAIMASGSPHACHVACHYEHPIQPPSLMTVVQLNY